MDLVFDGSSSGLFWAAVISSRSLAVLSDYFRQGAPPVVRTLQRGRSRVGVFIGVLWTAVPEVDRGLPDG